METNRARLLYFPVECCYKDKVQARLTMLNQFGAAYLGEGGIGGSSSQHADAQPRLTPQTNH